MVSFRTLDNQKRLTARVSEAGQSIFFVMPVLDVLQHSQRKVHCTVDHGNNERQQCQSFQQCHWASPLCRQAPGRSQFLKKVPFPALRLIHSEERVLRAGYGSMTTCNAGNT